MSSGHASRPIAALEADRNGNPDANGDTHDKDCDPAKLNFKWLTASTHADGEPLKSLAG